MTRFSPGSPTDQFGEDFLDFIAEMNAHEVEFVLVGGYAMGAHGVVRATVDIDFLYRATPSNVERLCRALRGFGAPANIITPVDLLQPDVVSAFGSPPHRIDLLSSITGVSFDAVWRGSGHLNVNGQSLRVIGLAELRQNKAATGRAKDRDDLRRLAKA
jgi:hypothetical protein